MIVFINFLLWLTDTYNVIQQICPLIGSLITPEQASNWPKILDEQSNFFKVTLMGLLMNTFRHGNFSYKNGTGTEICQQLATYIHSEYFLVHQYIQVLASYKAGSENLANSLKLVGFSNFLTFSLFSRPHFLPYFPQVNEEWHYAPFGIFRRNSNAVFTLFVEFYGLKTGADIFDLYKRATNILQGYPRYKLAMVLMCTVLHLLKKSSKMTNLGDKQVIIDMLRSHLKIMIGNMKMEDDVAVFQALLDKDWPRLEKIEFRLDSIDCVSLSK